MHDANAAAAPTAQDIDTTTLAYLDREGALLPGEQLSLAVHILELVHYDEEGIPTYRRVRVSDSMTHPGALQALVHNTAKDLDAAADRARHGDGPSSRRIERSAG